MTAWIAQLLLSLAVLASLPSDIQTITHVLERTSFGVRPGDVERVQTIGLDRYIDDQLHPERVNDAGLDARLGEFATLRMSSRDIIEEFARPLEEARKAAAAAGGDGQPNPEQQRRAATVVQELQQQKVVRAIYGARQLQEVLVDFWFNHFNVDARKGVDRFMLTSYERDVIRPHVFGKFRDLLEATAKSPAMLFYLDNWMSTDPAGPHVPFAARRFPPRVNAKAPKGLNENYGRELMELHTLGVDGGYTQKDVTEVARAFTGWTIDRPRQDGAFRFEPRLHDEGKKIVLGHVIDAGGMRDGEEVLDILAKHPSTARFIATKLVRHFVSDTPPPPLVDRVAARFRETGGDLREVMRTILTSPEFLSPEAYHAKVKTPFEFVVSAVRATDADVSDARPLVQQIAQLGEPLYQCQPPTGYKDTADAWVNTGALVGRMNFGLALASNKIRGVVVSNTTPDGIALGAPAFQRK
jgi:uncharacterized protein (DUF1800 family)